MMSAIIPGKILNFKGDQLLLGSEIFWPSQRIERDVTYKQRS
jgi:hypothetical protein